MVEFEFDERICFNFEIRIRLFGLNFVPRQILFEIRPSLPIMQNTHLQIVKDFFSKSDRTKAKFWTFAEFPLTLRYSCWSVRNVYNWFCVKLDFAIPQLSLQFQQKVKSGMKSISLKKCTW